ncbi:hypothetical protein CF328_g8151 [Tilletia controversa]|nr:hypothetical protein CF328_g8151 [Tilletia controversa]
MDQFNDWHHPPAITYDPNGFIANLDPAYISAAERVPANTTDPTPNLPTSSQRCLQLLPEDIRQAYKIAYEAIKRSIGQHQRPDWDLIWLEAVLSPPGLVKDALKAHFDKLFSNPANSTSSTTTSTFNAHGRAPTSLGNDQPHQPGSAVSMSPAALKAIRSNESWRGWRYCGVVRWEGGTTDSKPLTDDEILLRSRQVRQQSRGSKGNKISKCDKVRKQTTRAEDFPDLRERWECVTCGKVRHEQIATTSNLRKHRKDCGTTAGPK